MQGRGEKKNEHQGMKKDGVSHRLTVGFEDEKFLLLRFLPHPHLLVAYKQ